MAIVLVSDHDHIEYPGGAHYVNHNIVEKLGIPFIKTKDLKVNQHDKYIIANATFISNENKEKLIEYKNYSIMEHDYKIHFSRQPHLFNNGIFPKNELINLEFFKNAKTVFLQSKDHLDCYLKNNIDAHFINLSTSIWSDKELDLLDTLSTIECKNRKFAIIDYKGPHKGTENSISWCKNLHIDFDLIPKLSLLDFYRKLAEYPALVFLPNVRETFCRLVVEARCIKLNVIFPRIGATSEDWFSLSGKELINFLRAGTKTALDTIIKNT